MPPQTKTKRDWNLLFACWLIASGSTLGSLFFSHVMGFAPCVLCWYQRIALFPLVLILPMGLFPFDAKAAKFALPLTVAGLLTAVYHNLRYAGELSGRLRTLFLWEIGQAKIRRTEVRPMFRRRAISDLLTPARCSFRISAAWTAAVAGRPSRWPFSRA